jgi:hypothetical protein
MMQAGGFDTAPLLEDLMATPCRLRLPAGHSKTRQKPIT